MGLPRLRDRADAVRTVVRRQLLRRRRTLSAVCAAAAVLAGLHAVAPPPPETVSVLAAARDLPSGTVIGPDDLVPVDLPAAAVPDSAVSAVEATGRTVAAPVRRGETVTDVRLVGESLVAAHPGAVAVPVRIPDAGVVDLLRVGDVIDLVATDTAGAPGASPEGTVVADDVSVVALPQDVTAAGLAGSGPLGGRLVVIAADARDAEKIAGRAVRSYLTVTFSG
jgi:Flp pilus assembly protein CpaB